jgi:hypothetical protein
MSNYIAITSSTGQIVHLTKDVELIDNIINHEEVLPHVLVPGQDAGPLSSEILLKTGRAMFFISPEGDCGAAFVREGDTLEGHSFALPSARGRKVIEVSKAITEIVLSMDGVRAIRGYTPTSNKRACAFTRQIGYKSKGKTMMDRGYGVLEEVEIFIAEK